MKAVCAVLGLALVGVLAIGASEARAQLTGEVVGWGDNGYSQCDAPAPNENFTAVAGGRHHSLGLKVDGTVAAWYYSMDGQCLVPPPNSGFIGIAAGYEHSLGVKSDSTIVAWGGNDYTQCDVPTPNADFIAVAAGDYHSLGLKSDGSIVAWGSNSHEQCNVPDGISDFIAVAGGGKHSLGLRADGSVVGWGYNAHEQCDAPDPNDDFVAIAAGNIHSVGLKSDGTIIAWGHDGYDQCTVPPPNGNFVAVGAGCWHSLGVTSDSTVVAWGGDMEGQCQVPEPNDSFFDVAAGIFHSLALKRSETPVDEYFYATLRDADQAVLLRWSLPGCPDGVRLLVCRALSPEGPFTPVAAEPLPDVSVGRYVDETTWPGETFWYELRMMLDSGEETPATETRPYVAVPGALEPGIRHVTPNPSASGVKIGCALPEDWRSAALFVHDPAGRVVRRLAVPNRVHGLLVIEWDGKADSGERAASGVYFVRLHIDDAVSRRRVVLMR
jgi:hypothetical protein